MKAVVAALVTLVAISFPAAGVGSNGPPQTGTLIPGHDSAGMFQSFEARGTDMAPHQLLTSANAVHAARLLASCAVRRDAVAVKAFVLSGPVRIEYAKRSILKPLSDCFSGALYTGSQLKLTAADLKAFFAEALVPRMIAEGMSISERALPEKADWVRADPENASLNQTAVCVVGKNEPAVERLILTKPDDVAENKAVGDLASTIRSCIDPHATFMAGKVALRLSLSLALLHQVSNNI